MNILTTKDARAFTIILLLLPAICMLHLISGAVHISIPEVLRWAAGHKIEHVHSAVLSSLRLPRLIAALLAGSGLALSGLFFQSALKNPLAEPFLLGTASGAALGAVAAKLAGASDAAMFVSAFAGSIAATLASLGLSKASGDMSPHSLILSGVIVNFFASSLLVLIIILDNAQKLGSVYIWLMGSLARPDMPALSLLFAAVFIPSAALWLRSKNANLLVMDDDTAVQGGINPSAERVIYIALSSLIAAATVSAAGIIGFVGLIVPHACRKIFTCDHRILAPAALLCGALLVISADTAVRFTVPNREIPIGIITSLMGAPFFLTLSGGGKR